MTPPLDRINVGDNPNDDSGDALRVAFQKTNTAIESLDSAQLALGIPAGDEQLGDVPVIAPGDRASVPEDNYKERLDKLENRVGDAEQSTTGDQDLGLDFDLDSITGDVFGTTLVTADADGGLELSYPDRTGLYLVRAEASVEIDDPDSPSAGTLIGITITKEGTLGTVRKWISQKAAAEPITAFKEIGGSIPTARMEDEAITLEKIDPAVFDRVGVTLALPTGDDELEQLTGGDFAAMPVQLGHGKHYAMTATPLSLLPAFTVDQVDYFVDKYTGDDVGNTGLTEADPFETLEQAMKQSDLGTAWVAPGIYEYDKGWRGNGSADSVVLTNGSSYAVRRWDLGRSGEVILSTHQQSLGTWTASPNNAALWRNAVGDCDAVVDPLVRNEDGSFYVYHKVDLGSDVANAAKCASLPGSYYIPLDEGSRIDVNPLDGQQPLNDRLLVLFDVANVDEDFPRNVYCERITFLGGVGGARFDNKSGAAGGMALFESCNFYSSPGYGLLVKAYALTYAANCKAMGNAADGFQGFADTVNDIVGDYIFFNCESDNNGYGGSDNINGYSLHNGGRGLYVNCSAKGNRGPQFASTLLTQDWWVNCHAGASSSLGGGVGFSALDTGKGWAYRCTSEAEIGLSLAVSGLAVYQDECLFSVTAGDTPYKQA